MLMMHLRPAAVMLALFTLMTGFAYPLAMTGVAQAVFPVAANGSLISADGGAVGSVLIAQAFASPGYLQPRPSASGYNAAGTGASNLGPTSAQLAADVRARQADYTGLNGVAGPVDAVTASGSGLDPDISPENAMAQASRIAAARGVAPEEVEAILTRMVEGPWLGLYGLSRVNVLTANLALDEALPAAPSP